MKNLSSRLKYYINAHTAFTSIRKFETAIGWNNNTVNQLSDNPKLEKIQDLKNFDPLLNIEWLTTGLGPVRLDKPRPPVVEAVKPPAASIVSEENYIWIETYKIPGKSARELTQNYFADTFIKNLERGKIMVKKEDVGKFWEVEAVTDAMNCGSAKAIIVGDWFSAKDLPREEWGKGLKKGKVYYFLHADLNGIISEVVDHDTKTGEIKLRCWNEDKNNFPDYDINIKNCYIVAELDLLIRRKIN